MLASKIKSHLKQYYNRLIQSPGATVKGRLTRSVGLTLEAKGCLAAVGSRCLIKPSNADPIEAEVVGFSKDKLYLMCLNHTQGLSLDAHVITTDKVATVKVGNALMGRIINGAGKPLDDKGMINQCEEYPLINKPTNPLRRDPIKQPLDVGVQAINALLTVGRGQRMGLFAGSGVGKSVLLGMMTRFCQADVIVVGLIGERGREVKEFIDENLGPEGLARSVVVASPADDSPLMRLHGGYRATSIAEYYRDQGKHVLLLMDSLTRFAQAQREIALAVGEPPATKGYPPSVFTKLSALVERTGNAMPGGGSITAFYTVLTEGDDQQDPIADAARAILDGHIVLTRHLAEAGHYPAIDLEASISRVMQNVTSKNQQDTAMRFKQLYGKYWQNHDLINIGAYVAGSDPDIDTAIHQLPAFNHFLRQGIEQKHSYSESVSHLQQLFVEPNALEAHHGIE